MKIAQLKEAIMLSRDARVTPFIWGNRGVGKSQVIEQVGLQYKLGVIDMRCSQLEASDMRGLPDKVEGRTVFCPPADMPMGGMTWEEYRKAIEKPRKHDDDPVELKDNYFEIATPLVPRLNHGLLFLDELNRAQDDVIQAVFQLVLDRRLGQYALPKGWSVVVAGNYMEGYMTNGFTDAAFLDRFCHLQLSDGDTTLEEWVNYMGTVHGESASGVIEFASQNIKHLDGEIKSEMGFTIQPSRRSWEAVVRVEQACQETEYSVETKTAVVAGLVGWSLAQSYGSYNCPVRPQDIIQRGVKAMAGPLGELTRPQMTGLMWGLSSRLKDKIHLEREGKIAIDFTKWMCKHARDKDVAVAFCNVLVSGDKYVRERHAMLSNPNITKLFGKFREKGVKKTFFDYLNEDPELQKLVQNTAWGKDMAEQRKDDKDAKKKKKDG